MAKLILFQRVELLNSFQKKMCQSSENNPFGPTSPEIYRYTQARATHEGQGFSMSVTFFREWLTRGARIFWGVTTDMEGRVLSDVRDPEFLLALHGHERAPDKEKAEGHDGEQAGWAARSHLEAILRRFPRLIRLENQRGCAASTTAQPNWNTSMASTQAATRARPTIITHLRNFDGP